MSYGCQNDDDDKKEVLIGLTALSAFIIAAPISGIFRNWARKLESWCGTRPTTLVLCPA